MIRITLIFAALYGGLAVCLGAFGAHALSSHLSKKMQDVWHTAEQYQFYHALALLALGVLMRTGFTGAAMSTAAWCFIAGTFIFSGSLYLLAGSGVRILGAITPIGGVLLIVGWVALLIGVWRASS
ncbi:DUF423 domain-containing protein [Salinisphaera hydrothermalis]|uniref:DUF423 domain-containing protein n=1 Tax=Salinisphaera hydrothermalis (strain C41B8) TaxID=1304275 RepID=A0A084IL60_SALHC|nr:DUF423 domain-containing protein [Salinisphaera hydrothermalis]KEZ77444.1 hypothetical protein C41B8_09596 [Salinisphaera hydrothermalis C41B8]